MSFSEDVEQELAWRTDELTLLKHHISSHTTAGSRSRVTLLRSAWAMLYAHYEGFSKTVLRKYLAEIEGRCLPIDNFRYELVICSLRPLVAGLAKTASYDSYYDLIRFGWQAIIKRPLRFEKGQKGLYKLKGLQNMWPKLLQENCQAFGLPDKFIVDNWLELKLLVERRNHIAHGESEAVDDLKQFLQFDNVIQNVIVALGLAVIDAVEQERFLRRPNDYFELGRWLKAQKQFSLPH